MMTTITAPVVLITGAAKRIGRCIALHMAQHGWDIAIHYNASGSEALALQSEIGALGRRAVVLGCDLSNEPAVRLLVGQVIESLGSLQCVVNNASQFDVDTVADFSQALLDQHMHTNLAAPIFLAQGLHDVTAPDAQGCVINILDQKLLNLNPDFLSYTLSKAALQCATTVLAQALAPRVRVVGVAPGTTLASVHQDETNFAQTHRYAALDQSSTPQDIADAVLYLATARAVTGTILAVDGGQHLVPLARDVMYLVNSTNT